MASPPLADAADAVPERDPVTFAALAVATAAEQFLDAWVPKTDRFIEATLPLDAALNRLGTLLADAGRAGEGRG